MDIKKAKIIFNLTDEIHSDVNDIYEDIVDGDDKEAIVKIDKTIAKLRHLKSNISIKDKILKDEI